jgi:hypothetical protein
MKKEKEETNYTNVWMAFVDISAGDSYIFTELIDMEQKQIDNYIGAWCYIVVIANNISDALDIISKGLIELHFQLNYVDSIRNVSTLIEDGEISEKDKREIDSLLTSKYIFKILDKLWPYVEK